MNFENLLKKMQELDASVDESMQPPVQAVMAPASGPEYPESGEISLEELTAIKQLLGKMRGERDDDQGAHQPQFDVPSDDVLLGDEPPNDTLLGEVPAEEEWANSPESKIAKIAAVIATGDDLASKGKEALKVNGGGNPMQEALIAKLSKHYHSIKENDQEKKKSAWSQGWSAGYSKNGSHRNPYPEDSKEAHDWENGRDQGREDYIREKD